MAIAIDICKKALFLAHNNTPINSLDDNSYAASQCKLWLSHCNKELQSSYLWNFSIKYSVIQPLLYLNYDRHNQPPWPNNEQPVSNYVNPFPYAVMYSMPNDLLIIDAIGKETFSDRNTKQTFYFSPPPESDYQIPNGVYIGRKNCELPYLNPDDNIVLPKNPILSYGFYNDNFELYTPAYESVLTYYLAFILAKTFDGSAQWVQAIYNAYQQFLQRAMISDIKNTYKSIQYDVINV